jgi:Zn-dependent oligopeptidase
MKLTNKQIRQIIKEELDNVLNEEETSEEYEKIRNLITMDPESGNTGIMLFNSLKGSGTFQEQEEEHLERLSVYAAAVYEYKSLNDEIRKIRSSKTTPVYSRDPEEKNKLKQLKKQRREVGKKMYELEYTVNMRDKRALLRAAGLH